MKIEMHAKGIAMTRFLESYVERAVLFSLGRFAGSIRRAAVRLLDVNGPRGGVDKQCRIRLDLGRMGTSVVAETDSRIETAIDIAAERAGRTVGRLLEWRIDRRRRATPWGGPPMAVARGVDRPSKE